MASREGMAKHFRVTIVTLPGMVGLPSAEMSIKEKYQFCGLQD